MFTTANYKGACITDPDMPLLHGVNVVLCAWCYGSPLFAIDILFLLRLHLPRIFMTNRAPSSCVRLPCPPVSHLCRPDPDSATNNPATLIIATWRVLSALVAETLWIPPPVHGPGVPPVQRLVHYLFNRLVDRH